MTMREDQPDTLTDEDRLRIATRKVGRRTAWIAAVALVTAIGGLGLGILLGVRHSTKPVTLTAVLIAFGVAVLVFGIAGTVVVTLTRRQLRLGSDFVHINSVSRQRLRRVLKNLQKEHPIDPEEAPLALALIRQMRRQRPAALAVGAGGSLMIISALLLNERSSRWLQLIGGAALVANAVYLYTLHQRLAQKASRQGLTDFTTDTH